MTFSKNHKLRTKAAIAILLVGLIITQCAACSNESADSISFGEDWLLNTYCSITIFESGKNDIIKDAFGVARGFEQCLSRTIGDSDIAGFNAATESSVVYDFVGTVVERGIYFGKLTDGLFDITIAPVSKLWDFAAQEPIVPSSGAIAAGLEHVAQYDSICVSQGDVTTLTKTDPLTELDLGGIAKGFIADRMGAYLTENGVDRAIINLGGNVLTIGTKADGSQWVIGLEQPFSGQEGDPLSERTQVGLIHISSGSVVTSGTYERCFTYDGVLYHHVLDPATGYPCETDLDSATVMGPSSMDCDALSTICLLMGSKRALRFIEGMDDYDAILIRSDGVILKTSHADFTLKEN